MEKQMMIRCSQDLNFHAGRFLPTLALLAVCIPAVAQQATVSAPLSADEVVRRVVQMNEHRANALESYSSIRSYHLECHCLSQKKADMALEMVASDTRVAFERISPVFV